MPRNEPLDEPLWKVLLYSSGGGGSAKENPSMGGVWIFSGTAHFFSNLEPKVVSEPLDLTYRYVFVVEVSMQDLRSGVDRVNVGLALYC